MKKKESFPFFYKKRKSFFLLEVLIAFVLILITFSPLIAPHIWVLKKEANLVEEIKASHLSHLLLGAFQEKLFKNEISWSSLERQWKNKEKLQFSEEEYPLLHSVEFKSFKGSYSISLNKKKPEKDTDLQKYRVYLLDVSIEIEKKGNAPPLSKPFKALYTLFLIHEEAKTL